jgi:Domain of unknown function (DUF397)
MKIRQPESPMSPIGFEVRDLTWRVARRSAGNGACVEVAAAGLGVLVRDSKDQSGPFMQYPRNAWRVFLADAKKGHLDPDSL